MAKRYKSALQFVLLSLVPLTESNLLLTYKPNQFFNKLEKISDYNNQAIRLAYRRGKQRGLFDDKNGKISLSLEARQMVQPFVAKKINNGCVMVIFDIPNDVGYKRRRFRLVLRMLGFEQVQRSVWTSPLDHRSILAETVSELGIQEYVEIYEAARLKI